ncbi:MAG: peptidoglycan DD-metalloendopeptidase family protein [Rhodospirillales bacterium]|nr:peptidoglycan DD-metalloendopeptidase family protein [Rhodospirillales bacterium]
MKLGANAATGLGIALGLASIAAVALWSPAPTPPAETTAAGQAAPERDVVVALDSESPQEIVHLRPDSDIEDELGQPVRQVVQVDRGDTLLDLLVRVGVSSAEAHEAIGALRKVYNPRHLRAGQEVTVSFARPSDGLGAGVFQAISLTPEAGREVFAERAEEGFVASDLKVPTTRRLEHFAGVIRSSLFEAAGEAGLPTPATVEMVRAMSYDVDFQRDIQPEDSFEVLIERHYDPQGRLVRDGNLLFASMSLSGKVVTIHRHVDGNGDADYYNPKGESVRKALLRTPVDGARLSSRFGKRKHPILGYTKVHKGVDFAAPTGTPIMAAGTGTVEMAGPHGGYGYYVRIRHNNQYSTAYAHLSRFASGTKKGRKVMQGQIIGYVGSTGRSTGPHLHYEVLVGGKQINPLSIKVPAGIQLAGAELSRFKAAMRDTERTVAALKARSVASAGDSTAN